MWTKAQDPENTAETLRSSGESVRSGSEGGGLRSCHLHRHMGDPRRVGGHGNPGTRPPLG